jgi:5-formyltetrahydrofolate cyclo-ligase
MGEDHEQARRLLRREVTGIRRRLSGPAAAALSSAACGRIAQLPMFGAARQVVLYAGIENEVDPGALVSVANASGKAVYYPRMIDDGLAFVRADPAALVPGRFGVPEPTSGTVLSPATRHTIFVIPGLAFDLHGVRLGRGAGWYDRGLVAYPDAFRVGLAYEFQVVPRLPRSAWDVPMDAVVTDARLVGGGDERAGPLKEKRR